MKMVARFSVIGFLAALLLPAGVPADMGPDPELREILRAAASDSDSFPDRFEAEVWLTDMSGRLARHV
ncbi:MAG: lytic transglycosylase domain-containing protein, partial [Gammaproteobacteria bacterium]|nr:lytic transglycosylase domain-containing protein [Gammaproteobacteria bacterium]